jgi:hypothetical protein
MISGAVMGISKELLLGAVLLIPLVAFSTNNSKYISHSNLFSLEANIAQQVVHVTSGKMQQKFNKRITNFIESKTLK